MVHILCIHDRQKVQPNDITKICVQMHFFFNYGFSCTSRHICYKNWNLKSRSFKTTTSQGMAVTQMLLPCANMIAVSSGVTGQLPLLEISVHTACQYYLRKECKSEFSFILSGKIKKVPELAEGNINGLEENY